MDFYNQLLAQKLSGGGGGDSNAAFKSLVDGSIIEVTADMLQGVTSIRNYTFYSCQNLTSIEIPSSVTTIGEHAFGDCQNLTSIEISSGVTSIGAYAFNNCKKLTSIEIPNTVTIIRNGVFFACSDLANVTLSNNISTIPDDLFGSCTSLTTLTLPESITSIGQNAFQNYSGNWESLTVLSTVPPTANTYMFNCPVDKLTIYVPANSVDAYKSASGWSYYANQIQAIPSG